MRVVVTICGGVVQDVSADAPNVEVLVVNFDCDDNDNLTCVDDGAEVAVTSLWEDICYPVFVAQRFAEHDEANS